jgi:hypothetical protein
MTIQSSVIKINANSLEHVKFMYVKSFAFFAHNFFTGRVVSLNSTLFVV